MQNAIELYEDGRVSAVVIDRDRFTDGLTYEDFDTAVDITRSVRGACVAVIVKSTDEDGVYRVSLRGNNRTRVSGIAAAFGGGGIPAPRAARFARATGAKHSGVCWRRFANWTR